MKELRVSRIGFFSFIKLNVLLSACVGFCLSLLNPVSSLLGNGNVVTAFITYPILDGPVGWVLYMFLVPIFFGILGVLVGLVAYLPFWGVLRILKGVSLKVDIADDKRC